MHQKTAFTEIIYLIPQKAEIFGTVVGSWSFRL